MKEINQTEAVEDEATVEEDARGLMILKREFQLSLNDRSDYKYVYVNN